MWVSLIDKYGVIPQSEMSESFSSSQSSDNESNDSSKT
jgi:bleomycin hydrolase